MLWHSQSLLPMHKAYNSAYGIAARLDRNSGFV
jgi:hypothetical protein